MDIIYDRSINLWRRDKLAGDLEDLFQDGDRICVSTRIPQVCVAGFLYDMGVDRGSIEGIEDDHYIVLFHTFDVKTARALIKEAIDKLTNNLYDSMKQIQMP